MTWPHDDDDDDDDDDEDEDESLQWLPFKTFVGSI